MRYIGLRGCLMKCRNSLPIKTILPTAPHTVVARGCLKRVCCRPHLCLQSDLQLLFLAMVTTMALVWTVNSTLSWGCKISEFHIFPLQMPLHAARGGCPSSSPPFHAATDPTLCETRIPVSTPLAFEPPTFRKGAR